jgi:hypothetical protein
MLVGEVGPRGATGAARTAENAGAALDVLRQTISVAVHSPWRLDRRHIEGVAERRPRPLGHDDASCPLAIIADAS